MKPLEVGQTYRRREPKGDEWDLVRVRGYAEGGEVVEPVVSPVSFGQPVAVSPDNFLTHYTRTLDDAVSEVEAVAAKLDAWETEPKELTNG